MVYRNESFKGNGNKENRKLRNLIEVGRPVRKARAMREGNQVYMGKNG